MDISFPLQVFVLLGIFHFIVCDGHLTFSKGYIIEGQSTALFCRIPKFNNVAYWLKDDEQFTATTCSKSGFCKVENEGTRYKYSSNSSGISVKINTITRYEERNWTCGHPGYNSSTYRIRYDDSVFVLAKSVAVDGLDRNVTLGDKMSTLTLTFTTGCMHPYPIVAICTNNDTHSMIDSEVDYLNVTSTRCTAPEAGYTGSITLDSNFTCNATILPRLLITPKDLPFEYSTTEWLSSYYIKFPSCEDDQTNELAQSTQPDYVTETVNYVTTLSMCDSTVQSDHDQVPKQELSSLDEKVEMVVWISVACVVILIIILCFTVVVIKRTLILQRQIAKIEGHRLNIETERLAIEKRRLELEEYKHAAIKPKIYQSELHYEDIERALRGAHMTLD